MCYKLGSEGPPVAMRILLHLPDPQKHSSSIASFPAQALLCVCWWWWTITTTSALPPAAATSSSSSSSNSSSISSSNIDCITASCGNISKISNSSKAKPAAVPVVTMEAVPNDVLPPPRPTTQLNILDENDKTGADQTFGPILKNTSEEVVWSLPCPTGWVNMH